MIKNSTVIIVDDDSKVLSALERDLSDEGYSIVLANSGEEALEVLQDITCKVIVADIKMPKMNGFELLGKVKEQSPDMVCVVFSGHEDVKFVLEQVNKGGIDRYLTKPWEAEDVKATIKQCIELFDLRTEVKELRSRLQER